LCVAGFVPFSDRVVADRSSSPGTGRLSREGPCAALRPLEQRFWCGVAQPGGHKAKPDGLVGVLGFPSCLAVTLMYPWGTNRARNRATPGYSRAWQKRRIAEGRRPSSSPARWTASSGDSFGSAATEDRGERLMESDLELHAAESYASVSLKQETRQSKRELMRWSSPSAMRQANGA
jgi:hypothetical protein